MAEATDHLSGSLLLRWRGCLAVTASVQQRLELLSGGVLMLLLGIAAMEALYSSWCG